MLVLLTATAAQVVAQTPDYDGSVCPEGDGLRFEIRTDPDVTLVIIYPMLPVNHGGQVMTAEGDGVFNWTMPGQSAGVEVGFNLLMQNPQQYIYPVHQFIVGGKCTDFARDDVMPPPVRGFRHELAIIDGSPSMTFHAGISSHGLQPAEDVLLRIRVEGGPIQDVPMIPGSAGLFHAPVPAGPGQEVEYWFVQKMGEHKAETASFQHRVGEEPGATNATPETPVIARTAGRFRDRHPYEWRFDNYVELYDDGRSFGIEIIDSGKWLDVVVTTNPGFPVGRMDFKYFVYNDPAQCDRPLTGVNLVMDKSTESPNVFSKRVPDVTPGSIIDFDFTFTDLPAGNPVASYYSDFHYYQVGRGRFGHTGNRRAYPAGRASIPHVISPRFGFVQHAQGMSPGQLDRFMQGKLTFETDFESGKLLNEQMRFDCCSGPLGFQYPNSPSFREAVLGPRYSATSCVRCHVQDGRGRYPEDGEHVESIVFNVGIPGSGPNGEPVPHPLYGTQLDLDAIEGTSIEARIGVQWKYIKGTFDDGTSYELRRPVFIYENMAHGSIGSNVPDVDSTPGYDGVAMVSARMTPMLTGVGLLEAISETEILAREDALDLDGDGISGRANRVWDRASGDQVVGRFGWKASQPDLLQQAAKAFNRDMGMRNPIFPQQDCGSSQPDCADTGIEFEIESVELDLVREYLLGLAPPPRYNYEDPMAIEGMHLFKEANCHACHTPRMLTRSDHPIESYRSQHIEPFTDLLLHDMGPGLADSMPEFNADGNEWRTPPLWALGYVKHANGLPQTCEDPWQTDGQANFLHDGRARTIMEAILWHGGEAEASRRAVLAMNAVDRQALIAFVEYPFDDPIFHTSGTIGCIADVDGDGTVGQKDLALLLASWGGNDPSRDLDGDGVIGGGDLGYLLGEWGPCSR